MKKRHILATITILCLTGCQYFAPCHQGTWVVGTVMNSENRPLIGATVSLYGSEQKTDEAGRFIFEMADRLPFTFTAKADGYQYIEVPRRIGHFRIEVRLEPDKSPESSRVIWKKLGSEEYEKLKKTPNRGGSSQP